MRLQGYIDFENDKLFWIDDSKLSDDELEPLERIAEIDAKIEKRVLHSNEMINSKAFKMFVSYDTRSRYRNELWNLLKEAGEQSARIVRALGPEVYDIEMLSESDGRTLHHYQVIDGEECIGLLELDVETSEAKVYITDVCSDNAHIMKQGAQVMIVLRFMVTSMDTALLLVGGEDE